MVPQDSGWQPLSQAIDVTGVWRGRGRLGERKGKGPLWIGRWIQTWKIQKSHLERVLVQDVFHVQYIHFQSTVAFQNGNVLEKNIIFNSQNNTIIKLILINILSIN